MPNWRKLIDNSADGVELAVLVLNYGKVLRLRVRSSGGNDAQDVTVDQLQSVLSDFLHVLGGKMAEPKDFDVVERFNDLANDARAELREIDKAMDELGERREQCRKILRTLERAVTPPRPRVNGASREKRGSRVEDEIVEALRKEGTTVHAKQLASLTGRPPSSIATAIGPMVNRGQVERVGRGFYRIPAN